MRSFRAAAAISMSNRPIYAAPRVPRGRSQPPPPRLPQRTSNDERVAPATPIKSASNDTTEKSDSFTTYSGKQHTPSRESARRPSSLPPTLSAADASGQHDTTSTSQPVRKPRILPQSSSEKCASDSLSQPLSRINSLLVQPASRPTTTPNHHNASSYSPCPPLKADTLVSNSPFKSSLASAGLRSLSPSPAIPQESLSKEHPESCACVSCETQRTFHALLRDGDGQVRQSTLEQNRTGFAHDVARQSVRSRPPRHPSSRINAQAEKGHLHTQQLDKPAWNSSCDSSTDNIASFEVIPKSYQRSPGNARTKLARRPAWNSDASPMVPLELTHSPSTALPSSPLVQPQTVMVSDHGCSTVSPLQFPQVSCLENHSDGFDLSIADEQNQAKLEGADHHSTQQLLLEKSLPSHSLERSLPSHSIFVSIDTFEIVHNQEVVWKQGCKETMTVKDDSDKLLDPLTEITQTPVGSEKIDIQTEQGSSGIESQVGSRMATPSNEDKYHLTSAPELDGTDQICAPCSKCNRSFRQSALAHHVNICDRVFKQKRRRFDSAAQRRLEETPIKSTNSQQTATVKGVENKWRQRSEAFREAMRSARAVSAHVKAGKSLSDLPPPAPTAPELDDRIPCPHCGRRFAEETARRHIGVCNKIKAKPKMLMRSKQ